MNTLNFFNLNVSVFVLAVYMCVNLRASAASERMVQFGAEFIFN